MEERDKVITNLKSSLRQAFQGWGRAQRRADELEKTLDVMLCRMADMENRERAVSSRG